MLRARVARSYFYRMAFVGGLFALMGSVMIWQGLKRGIWLMFVIGVTPTLIWLAFTMFEYRRGALEFDAEGVTRRDGKRFLWAELREIRRVHMRYPHGGQGPLNHIELHFPGGQTRIFPVILENAGEVLAFVAKLPAPASARA